MPFTHVNFEEGLVNNNPLLAGGTTLDFGTAPNFPTITGSDPPIQITLDQDGPNEERVLLTAYTATQTTGTITATANEHAQNTPWVASIYAESLSDLQDQIDALSGGGGSGGGAVDILAKMDAPVSGAFDFDLSAIDLSQYSRLFVEYHGIRVDTADTFGWFRFRQSGGIISSANYGYQGWSRRHDGVAQATQGNGDTKIVLVAGSSQQWTTSSDAHGEILIRDPSATIKPSMVWWDQHDRGGSMIRVSGAGHLNLSAAIDGFQILPSTGNITAGQVIVKGFRKVAAGGGSADYATEIAADSPVSWLRLADTSGTTAADASGNGNTGTYEGGVTLEVGGIISGDDAVSLDGTDDYIEWDSIADDLATLDAYTLESWFKCDDYTLAGSGQGRVLFAVNTTGGGNRWFLRAHVDATATALQGALLFTDAGASAHGISPVYMNAGIWHHVVCVYKDGLMIVYLDGDPVLGYFHATNLKIAADDLISIGQEWDAGSESDFFKGDVDEAAAYTAALSPARIQAHFRAANNA